MGVTDVLSTETELEELLTISEGYLESGISALDKNLGEENWSYGQSILFTVTVVTTIGDLWCSNRIST